MDTTKTHQRDTNLWQILDAIFLELSFLRGFMWIDITLCKNEGMKYSDNNYEFNFLEMLTTLI